MLKILVTYAVQGEFVELKWPDIEPYYVRTGIGKVKSAFHLAEAIRQVQPDLVLNIGSAGTVNNQVGDNFNQRFERLVYNCYMLLPEKERQLRELENQIAQRRRQLEDLVNRYHSAAGCLRSLEYQLRDMQSQLSKLAGMDS